MEFGNTAAVRCQPADYYRNPPPFG